jgi:hypothetical protein
VESGQVECVKALLEFGESTTFFSFYNSLKISIDFEDTEVFQVNFDTCARSNMLQVLIEFLLDDSKIVGRPSNSETLSLLLHALSTLALYSNIALAEVCFSLMINILNRVVFAGKDSDRPNTT